MEKSNHPGQLATYLKNNWFKIGIIALLIYAFFQKDLSFQINLKAPAEAENPKGSKKERPSTLTDLAGSLDFAGSKSNKEPGRLHLIPDFPEMISLRQQLALTKKEDQEAYLRRFAQVAVSESKKFGIPASIILASALLQSGAGKADLTKKSNNHFRLRCSKNWDGEFVQNSGICYRKYQNAWSSFRDHSHLLRSGDFKMLQKFGTKDYQNWAKGLEKIGLNDEPGYGALLVEVIEKFGLQDLDGR